MFPDIQGTLDQLWGGQTSVAYDFAVGASNLVFGTNPPFTAADFQQLYPKWLGSETVYPSTSTASSAVVEMIATAGIKPASIVIGPGVPANTIVLSVDSGTQITLNNALPTSGTVNLQSYTSTLVPMAVINAYIALASASLVQARWQDAWVVGVSLFVAHFLTLWYRTDGSTCVTPSAAANAGLARGILVAKQAGPVSASIQPITGLDEWAGWNESSYGVQFATLAKVIGMGSMMLW